MRLLVKRLIDTQKSQDFRTGPGMAERLTPFGRVLRTKPVVVDFSHPWLVTLQGTEGATLLPGTINKVPATILGVPLAGDPDKNQDVPTLQWGKPMLDSDGVGYICAEVTCAPKTPFGITTLEIVQVANPDTEDGSPGDIVNPTGGAMPLKNFRSRWPLARLEQRQDGRLDLFQIEMANLKQAIAFEADGVTPYRHFFW